MAEPAPIDNVVPLNEANNAPPPAPAAGAPAASPGGGGKPRASREKRRKKPDGTRIQRLFKDFRYQYGSDIAWDVENRMPIKISHLRHTFGNDEVRLWMNSDDRKVVMAQNVVFDPSESCGEDCVNLFAGLQVQSRAGYCQPVLDLLAHLCNDDESVYDWILDWIAWQLQHPGAKLPSSVVMHGDEGSGKNLFWERCVRELFGEYGSTVGQAELDNQYNGWISRRLFIVCDEVITRAELRHSKGKLKAMISGERIQINEKFMPVREERNHVNLVFLSNELQPLALDQSDRRYCVVWTPPKREREFYQRVTECLAAGGLEAFMHLLQERDLSAFDPYAPPPATQAKADLIDLGLSKPERFWRVWSNDELPAPRMTCTADQAFRLYRRWCVSEGINFHGEKNVFSRMVLRAAGSDLAVRMARLQQKTTRVWVMHREGAPPPPDEGGFGKWVAEEVRHFESYLHQEGGHES